MMDDSPDNYLEASIVKSTTVRIERLDNSAPWEHPVHALNWFDTRLLVLYNLYNLLAARSVINVGGTPLIKGKLVERVVGDDENQRQVLLLVKYPTPKHFKTMLENTYFKLVSILRGLAVTRFTFCLSHEQELPGADSAAPEVSTDTIFAVHHFRGDATDLQRILAALEHSSVPVTFSSLKTHQLAIYKSGEVDQIVPSIMDGIVLFNCEDKSTLHKLVNSDAYQHAISQTQSGFIGLYKRLL